MKALLTASLVVAIVSTGVTAIAQENSPSPPALGYAPPQTWPPAPNPLLLVKSKRFFIHDFYGLTKEYRFRFSHDNPITYTSRDTGKVHILYSSGDVELGSHVPTTDVRRILGVALNDENIYFCVWQKRFYPAPQMPLSLDKGALSLLVFRGSDGHFIQEVPVLPDMDVSKIEPEDNLGLGPLRLEKNAIICFDQTFKFNKGSLIAPKALPPKKSVFPVGP